MLASSGEDLGALECPVFSHLRVLASVGFEIGNEFVASVHRKCLGARW
jgi:hypothetical protein